MGQLPQVLTPSQRAGPLRESALGVTASDVRPQWQASARRQWGPAGECVGFGASEHSSPSFESKPASGTWGWGTWHLGRLKVCKVAEPRGTEELLLAGGVHSFPSVITVSRAAVYAGLARSGRGA